MVWPVPQMFREGKTVFYPIRGAGGKEVAVPTESAEGSLLLCSLFPVTQFRSRAGNSACSRQTFSSPQSSIGRPHLPCGSRVRQVPPTVTWGRFGKRVVCLLPCVVSWSQATRVIPAEELFLSLRCRFPEAGDFVSLGIRIRGSQAAQRTNMLLSAPSPGTPSPTTLTA